MTKKFVDQMIQNMKRAGMVTKASPWLIEGRGNKQMSLRHVGIKMQADWFEIFSAQNNLLVTFLIDTNTAYLEFYLANKTPFLKIISLPFHQSDTWERLFGEVKRILKKDKSAYLNHTDSIGNLYALLKPHVHNFSKKHHTT